MPAFYAENFKKIKYLIEVLPCLERLIGLDTTWFLKVCFKKCVIESQNIWHWKRSHKDHHVQLLARSTLIHVLP